MTSASRARDTRLRTVPTVHDGGSERDRLRRLVRVGAVAGVVGILAALPLQATLATGQGLGAITESGVFGDVAWLGYVDQPASAGASIVPAVVGLIALALGVVAVVVERLRTVGLLAGGVFLTTWAVFRLGVLSNPVLPTTVPVGLERLVTALALGVGVGAVVVAFRSGALAKARLPAVDD